MFILGLSGAAGSGKDTVANYLVKRYGFVKFAVADPLRQEVQQAFGLADRSLFLNREMKEVPASELMLVNCTNNDFVALVKATLAMRTLYRSGADIDLAPISPRQILQWWGTEYRRAQDEDYWVKQAAAFVTKAQGRFFYPEQAPQHFVIPDVRFENERGWIKATGGNIWHVHRDGLETNDTHSSAQPLAVQPRERQIWNNDSIVRLWNGVELLLDTAAAFVRVEPMEERKTKLENAAD